VKLIRKVSIGIDYKNSMHFVVGQEVLDKSYHIDYIKNTIDGIEIWIKKANEIILWKSFNKAVPVVIEYNIDF
jgi:hypothetical protein